MKNKQKKMHKEVDVKQRKKHEAIKIHLTNVVIILN